MTTFGLVFFKKKRKNQQNDTRPNYPFTVLKKKVKKSQGDAKSEKKITCATD